MCQSSGVACVCVCGWETPQGLNLKCQRHQRAPIVHVDHEAATQIAMAFPLPSFILLILIPIFIFISLLQTYLKDQELCVILAHRVGAVCSYLGRRDRVCSIVDKQMVIAVQLEHVEAQHEALQDRVRLEGDDTVQVALVL